MLAVATATLRAAWRFDRLPFDFAQGLSLSLRSIPRAKFLDRWAEDAAACLATVSRIEVLGFPRWHLLDEMRRARLELLVGALPELPPG